MSDAQVLVDTGGLVVTDDGRRVLVFDRGTGPLAVTAFVLGIITLVVGGFGAVALFSLSAALGAAFLAVGVAAAVAATLVIRRFRKRRAQPLNACKPVAVIDRKLNLFSYAGGAVIQLDQVRFERRMSLGSSSPKLVAVLPNGSRVLKRGNPFDGGVGNVDEVLTAAVARAPR
ncbi:hypothetical protein [Mycolicibacterium arenosum]|uniref:Uncharacterized protein n=1 Tax=Mycolicibacterium arenosum TaxID=2952157 RepID=A0ABT1M2P5_9MYCO|nr:hypothetical protein [Mycolicibacterium sp. CAU 1645]MCP9272880.1 hypothetical protein [Mycolicibacterium sp. CAU 1645]